MEVNQNSNREALEKLFEIFEDFLDDYKERAFLSAFLEPAKFYFDIIGDRYQKDHVNVHGLNWLDKFLL